MTTLRPDASEDAANAFAAYGDCAGPGEMKHIWREGHLCLRCGLAVVCHLGRAADDAAENLLPMISRCAAFTDAG